MPLSIFRSAYPASVGRSHAIGCSRGLGNCSMRRRWIKLALPVLSWISVYDWRTPYIARPTPRVNLASWRRWPDVIDEIACSYERSPRTSRLTQPIEWKRAVAFCRESYTIGYDETSCTGHVRSGEHVLCWNAQKDYKMAIILFFKQRLLTF